MRIFLRNKKFQQALSKYAETILDNAYEKQDLKKRIYKKDIKKEVEKEYKSKLEDLNEEIDSLSTGIQNRDSEIRTLENKISILKDRIEQKEEMVEFLQHQLKQGTPVNMTDIKGLMTAARSNVKKLTMGDTKSEESNY